MSAGAGPARRLRLTPPPPGARLHLSGLSVECLSSPAQMERLRPEWDDLLADSDASTIFLTWEWLSAWAELLLPGDMALLAVREGRKLIGLAPLVQEPARLLGVLPSSRLKFLGTGTVGSDYLDVVLRRGHEETAAAVLAGQVAARHVALEMGQIRDTAPGADRVAGHLAGHGWTLRERPINVCPFIPLSGITWDGYLAGLGSEHRYNVKRRLRNLQRDFRVEFQAAGDEAARVQALEHLLALHRQRWSGRGGSDALGDPAVDRFHQVVTRRLLERGWLRLFTLHLDGAPAAALYGFRHGPVFSFYQSGLDPRFSRHSVGLVLMALCIRSAIEEGAEEFDMLHGAEEYKFLWARRTRSLRRLTAHPPGPAGYLARAEQSLRALGGGAARLLPASLRRRVAWWRGTPLAAPAAPGSR
jgi:CelD/BcsL family acetyltransferase involved in cellulose biosynthesis